MEAAVVEVATGPEEGDSGVDMSGKTANYMPDDRVRPPDALVQIALALTLILKTSPGRRCCAHAYSLIIFVQRNISQALLLRIDQARAARQCLSALSRHKLALAQ